MEITGREQPAHWLPETVLVVEDDPAFRDALAELIDTDPKLRVAGCAADAREAIAMVRSLRPDACLCDVRLPGGGGQLVASEARRSAPETRVVALSACDDLETILGMIQAGAVSYIVKGTPGDEVLDGVHRALRGQSSMPTIATNEVAARLRGHDTRSEERVALLRKVLDHNLMSMVFQPIVAMRTGVPMAYEALCRISAPPPRTPDLWFEDAAWHGLGLEFELKAIRLALDHLPHLPARCLLHVNASPAVAMTPEVAALLTTVEPGRIVLEITEHTEILDYAALTAALAPLRASGVLIGVDDAGSGFSSMSHIVNMEPDVIKLDISLVRDVHLNRIRRSMVGALAEFARQAGPMVVAEAVEVEEERSTLLSLGVNAGQGYLFGRPAPCVCVAAALEEREAVAISA